MTPFLKQVAQDIYTRFNGQLADVAVVFPNKRAGLFFNEYLMECSGHPMWSPIYITISELFRQCSDATIGDPILLVSKLYEEYVRHTHSSEPIDSFYYWGELMIKDFDDIDKNMADASKLFANLADLRSIGEVGDALSDEQRVAIGQFFDNFKMQQKSELKQRFLQIWKVIGDVYEGFKSKLRSEGLAYEGMLYRDVLENDVELQLPYKAYAFVGFNALNRVESSLFETIKRSGKALFYWDCDSSYINDNRHEAGRFMRRNIKEFPNAIEDFITDSIGSKQIDVVSAATDSIQMRHVSQWIQDNIGKNEVETAVVLCDESRLETLYHTIPPCVKERNITMGFPVAHTPVFDLVKMLVRLQTTDYDEKNESFTLAVVHDILTHPYILRNSPNAGRLDKELTDKRIFFPSMTMLHADDLLATIFTRHTDNVLWLVSMGDIIQKIARATPLQQLVEENDERSTADVYNELFLEAQLKVYTQIQRLVSILGDGGLILRNNTLGSLLIRILAGTTIPFHGEPVVGMQIMGLLETRNLDFKNIIFVSANEGNLPKKSSENSFIPYNLRRAFGLTLSEHRDSIYAYNFYRLLQRASNITILYNSSTDSAGRGECSRYILQLMAAGLCREKKTLVATHKSSRKQPVPVTKTPQMLARLHKTYNCMANDNARTLSPSAINSYLACTLRFFYRYVVGLKRYEEVDTDVKKNQFGLIFHKAAELFYNEILKKGNGTIERGDLLPYIEKDALLYPFVDEAFREEFFNANEGKLPYDGEQFINREVLHHLLKRLIRMDAAHAPFEYVGSEEEICFEHALVLHDSTNLVLRIGGRADRIDRRGDTIEIIDYKTGGEEEVPDNLAQVFAHEGRHPGYIFQALLYSVAALENKKDNVKVSPSLIYIHKKNNARREDFVVKIDGNPLLDTRHLRNDFRQMLDEKLKEMFDISMPFAPTDDEERCKWCDFKHICWG